MIKKFVKKTIVITAFLVAVILISSSSMSITLSNSSEIKNLDLKVIEEEKTVLVKDLTGLDPNSRVNNPIFTTEFTNNYNMKANTASSTVPLMYGYVAYGGSSGEPEGPCYYPLDDPGDITVLSYTMSPYFISGGTWTCDEIWLGCEYNTGVLWVIDPETGDMYSIGGGGTACNGLAWDPVYNRLYGTSGSALIEYDPETGEQEVIGSHGVSNTMIALAINSEGECYAWDVLFSGTSKLWKIDTETGEATEVGSLGIPLTYAQDGCFDWETGILYLAAYSSSGFLATCDIETGELTTIGAFEGGAEITASMINHPCWCHDNDVGVKNILNPMDEAATEDIDVSVLVKNYGNNTEKDIPVNVVILKDGVDEEYNETVDDVELEPGEEVIVDFPTWTPDDWQTISNKYINYTIIAYTSLWGDDNPNNDKKEKWFKLYFGYFHDIEITSIDSPCEDGPGKTYPVKATIKNVGQYADCCIPIDIKIGEPVVLETLLNEEAWETVPPAGWYDEHKDFSNNYGWDKSYTSYSDGTSPEAILRYYQTKPDHVLYSYAINTSNYSSCRFEFKSYINHYSGQGLYALEAGYSTDAETWYAVWHEEPRFSGQYDVKCSIEGGHETTYIGFWVKGDPNYFNYWYIDDISLKVFDLVPEYSDSACQGDDLEPGETRTFEFDDWTPDFLQYETSGSKNYIVHAEIEMEGDENPGNDIKSEYFTLDYWHDVGIHEITSPSDGTRKGDILWDNGEPDGENALPSSMYQGYSNIIIDDFQHNDNVKWYATDAHFSFVWDSGTGTGNLDTVKVYFFENQGNCDPSMDEWAEVEVTAFNEWATGDYYFGRPEIRCVVEFEEVYLLYEGKWYVGFQPDGIEEDIAYLLTAESKGCQVMADLPYWGYPRWSSSQEIWDQEYDLSWQLTGYATCMCPSVYIQPGTEDIDVIVKNYGTFPEMDLTCYAEIYEYITDPENGTLVYEDNITNIDLDEPLGGEEILEFEDYDFSMEGIYHLELDMPVPNDDYPYNNLYKLKVRVDDTSPFSWHILDPPEPDGENGWYISDIEVTLQATDPLVNEVSSGVKEIKYQVNGGPIEIIPGNYGYFLLTQEDDGDDVLVEYWAIDNVGNEESPHNTFTVDMDQTDPSIDLSYTVTGGNQNDGWTLLFEAFATDETSGMDRVEFYLNEVLQETVFAPGPYEWSFKYYGGLNIIITAKGFDKAGNMASDEVIDPKTITYNQNTQQQSKSQKSLYFNSQQKLFVISEEGNR